MSDCRHCLYASVGMLVRLLRSQQSGPATTRSSPAADQVIWGEVIVARPRAGPSR